MAWGMRGSKDPNEKGGKDKNHYFDKNISIGNNMICNDIWHKYHDWYF